MCLIFPSCIFGCLLVFSQVEFHPNCRVSYLIRLSNAMHLYPAMTNSEAWLDKLGGKEHCTFLFQLLDRSVLEYG